MSTDIERSIHVLTLPQRKWSTAKIRQVLRAKWPHRQSKNYFYAEVLRRKKEQFKRSK